MTLRPWQVPLTVGDRPERRLYASELFTRDRGEATVFLPVGGHEAPGSLRVVGRVVPLVIPADEHGTRRTEGAKRGS